MTKAFVDTTSKSYAEKASTVKQSWHLVDADGEVVGRLAVKLATILMGKHKATYTPHVDCGDFVVVLNADKVRFSGRSMTHPTHPYFTAKMSKKTYDHYTGFPGGRKVVTAEQLLVRNPSEILRLAVRRMLPKTTMGRHMLKKLKLFSGTEHPHQSQQPTPLDLKSKKTVE